jgi:hypothetical protein
MIALAKPQCCTNDRFLLPHQRDQWENANRAAIRGLKNARQNRPYIHMRTTRREPQVLWDISAVSKD